MTNANLQYQNLLNQILNNSDQLVARNHSCFSNIDGLQATFNSFPLITVRKTAWRKAIREMEWFMSGEIKCPETLLDWWKGQLNPDGDYVCGYPHQMRNFSHEYDQVAFILNALKTQPNSRRIIMTTWNPKDMAEITKVNANPMTPTCCHGTETQFFVRNGELTMHTTQRSADMLLGVPHNWVQYWALLLYFAYHSSLKIGKLVWNFGDAHIYDDTSHISCAKEIISGDIDYTNPTLVYSYSGEIDHVGVPVFKTTDFSLVGEIPKPKTTIKPKLF